MQHKKLIHEWTEAQVNSASKPNFGKLYVTAPNLFKLFGSVSGKKILELGCGNGYWLRLLAKAGAHCTGIDNAENQINSAKNWQDPYTHNINYLVGDITENLELKESFDIVFLEHVLLEIPDKVKLNNTIANAARFLDKKGILVISDLHPFAPSSGVPNIRILSEFSYYDSGASIEIKSNRIDGKTIYYKDVHWTLEDICTAVLNAGLKITTVLEPIPKNDDIIRYEKELRYRTKYPMAIMIKAEK